MSVQWTVRGLAESRGIHSATALALHARINKNTANAIWNGRSLRVDRDTLTKLCAALTCTPGDLLGYDEEIEDPLLAAA